MVEFNGKLEKYNRIAMNYYGVTDKDFENEQQVFVNDGVVKIYDKNNELLEER